MRPEQLKLKKTVIRWTDEEWDRLAELVHAMRRNSPDSIATLANRAQKQFPKERQRPGVLTTVALQPLVERVQKMDREIQAKAEKCDTLTAKLSFYEDAPATKEELLASLSDEELRARFGPRLLQMLAPADVIGAFSVEALLDATETADLAAMVTRRLVKDVLKRPLNVTVQMPEQRAMPASHRIKTTSGNGQAAHSGHNGRKKRVVIIGTKGDQPRRLYEKVGALVELTCIDVEKLHPDVVPRNADHVIIWSKFVSHHHRQMVLAVVEPHRVSEHFDGLTELTEFIEDLCGAATVK